ncbi:hypothetical protein AB0A60_19570 [Streptomyces sp. NPDC046275]|uniref:hypothetical protein n=1 Tax=Streptomyces sp. NPDC046275 TaxID=3157201 RepID=UPI0033ECAC46
MIALRSVVMTSVPLGRRRDPSWDVAPLRHAAGVPARDEATAARETVGLVLGEGTRLPASAQDAIDLTDRLRGHIERLGRGLGVGHPVLCRAQVAARQEIPADLEAARAHVQRLARAITEIIEASETSVEPLARKPAMAPARISGRNRGRLVMFALAVITVIFAASLPRDATGAAVIIGDTILIALILPTLLVPFILPALTAHSKGVVDKPARSLIDSGQPGRDQ